MLSTRYFLTARITIEFIEARTLVRVEEGASNSYARTVAVNCNPLANWNQLLLCSCYGLFLLLIPVVAQS